MAIKEIKKVLILNKKEGETPLECLERFRFRHKAYKDVKMTYAGRLDPMARGLLLILAGEEAKNKEKYLALDKEYEFEVLFGFATDTYDILGKILHYDIIDNVIMSELVRNMQKSLKYFTGTFIQKYPMYSSKTVKGRQLFKYARTGEEVDIPEREVNVKELKFLKLRKITSTRLLANIEKRISKVGGDFRQKEILNTWKKYLAKKKSYLIGSFRIRCSSGTYVRGIANSLGENINIPALAFSIQRTKIGKFVKMV